MKTSQKGIDGIKAFEGFEAKAYNDPPGSATWSIGYGHQIQSNEQNLMLETISTAKGEQLLKSNLIPLEARLNKAKYTFNQNEFDGLVSFGYNLGEGSLQKIIDTWNATHDIKQVTAQMALYVYVTQGGVKVKSAVLEKRRASEIMTMLSPSFPVLAVVGLASIVAMYALVRKS